MSLLQGLMPAILGNTSFINSLLVSAGVAVSLLDNLLQNGNSTLGTIPGLVLPPFLGGPGHDALPWGNRTANGTNYYEDIPDTGVVRYYDLHVARGRLAPDGYEKDVILVNGQFPGPLLEANWGDWFEITVHNDLEDEGTALHWHGLRQLNSQFYDGVPGVSQCPIAPGESLVYRFQADLYGSTWYHSHYTAQYTDGVYGPMVIHGPSSAEYDIDLGPLLISDYYHKPYVGLIEDVMSKNIIRAQTTFADNTLVQGKMNYDCSSVKDGTPCQSNAGIAKLQFQTVMVASIDYHTMTVIENDFVPVVPYDVTTVTLAAGQRLDVLVKGNPSTKTSNGAYFLRVRQPTLCALAFQPFGLAAIYYDGADTNAAPKSLPQPEFLSPRLIDCANEPLSISEPIYPIALKEPDVTTNIDIILTVNETGNSLYAMNGHSFRADYNNPALLAAQQGNLSFLTQPRMNSYNYGNNQTIRIIFKNNAPFAHPMHVHGQNMFVLDEGVGSWDGKTIIRPDNPQRRDTQILQPNGYLVVQLESDNPGVWPFHCHFSWHVSQGLYINVIQKPDEITKLREAAAVIDQSCDAWDRYTAGNFVDQIDSGVKFREMLAV